MTDFSYTIGADQWLRHRRRVAVGAYGDVHEVKSVV
jgi:hypothetical protein